MTGTGLTWAIWIGDNHGHVVPNNDLAEHFEDECWCKPTPDRENPYILVHHAMDRREELEEGERRSA